MILHDLARFTMRLTLLVIVGAAMILFLCTDLMTRMRERFLG